MGGAGRIYVSSTCTNKIESLWRSCKKKFKEMNGCNRIMLKSYIDDILMMNMSALCQIFEENYKNCVPGNETDSETFDLDSQSGSEIGEPELNQEIEGADEYDEDGDEEYEVGRIETNDEEDDKESTVNEKSLTTSTAMVYQISDNSYSDADKISDKVGPKESIKQMIIKEEKIAKLSKEMENMYEIKSIEQSQVSNDSEEIIKRVLSDKRNPTPCPDCGKYMEGPRDN
ncbi:hypothetical protein BpHYR1_026083 [Brachionus plicatilis]|uniref:Uncharacterized protein n=1 Tax=Brachionus plicatilis TaxID=10195 RepID=A0A3M7S648_BRAPC|nr:hypothetical protein BpHYR1_026083 [Brachionus plicatilis]